MLDVYKFLEEKKKQTLPPGIVDLSSAPRVSMPAPPQKTPSLVPVTPAPSAPDIQPTVQPIQPQADLMRSFRALEAATPTPEQQRVVAQLKTIAKPPAVDMVTGAAPSVKPPDVSGADLIRRRERERARAIMSGVPAVQSVDFSKAKAPAIKKAEKDTDKKTNWISTVGRSLAAGTADVQTSFLNLARLIHRGAAELTDLVLPDSVYKAENDPVVKKFEQAIDWQQRQAETIGKPLEELEGAKQFVSTGLRAVPTVVSAALVAYGIPGAIVSGPAALTPTAKTVAQAFMRNYPNIARMLPFGAQAAGGTALEAEKEGANYAQQVAAGVLTGMGEMATEALPLEYAMRSIKAMGVDNLVGAGAKNLLTKYKNVGINYLKALVAETLEEVAMAPIGETIRKSVYAPEIPWTGEGGVVDPQAMLQAGYGGLAMSVMLGALGLPATARSHVMADRAIRQRNKNYNNLLQDMSVQLRKDLSDIEAGLSSRDATPEQKNIADEFTKIVAPMLGAEQIVYNKILEQGGTRQEAQQIVEQINDVFAKHGLEFNIGNVVKHFGDVLGVTYSGATGKAWKPTAKADKAEEPVIPPAEATVTPQTPEEIRRAMQEYQITQQAERERQAAEEELQAKKQEKEKAKKIREMEKRIAELMGGKPTAKAPAAPTTETETTPTTETEATPEAGRRTNLALRAEVDKLSPEEKDEVIKDLRARVFTDELTGLKNRAAYMMDEKQPVQAIIDLDNLKWVNDNIGHGAGDTLIKSLAAELPEGSYRLSGDEFVVQGQSREELATALSDIETRLNEQVLELAGDKQAVSKKGIGFSYGIGETLDKAETALQEHKKARLEAGKRAERGEVPPGIDISKREEDTIQTIKPNSVVRSTAGSTAGKLYTVLEIDGNKATVKSHDTGQNYRFNVSTLELVEDSAAGVTPTPETGVSQPPTTEAAEGEGVTDDILNKNIEKILEPYKFMIHMRTDIDWIDSLAEGSRGDDATDEYGNSLREAVKSMLIYPAGLSKAQAEQKVAEMEASFDQAEKERSSIRAKFGLANALAERPSRSKSFFTEEQYKKDKDYEIIEQAVVEGLLTKTAHTDRDGEKGYLFQRKGDLWSFLVKQGYYAEMGITATDDVEPETTEEVAKEPWEMTREEFISGVPKGFKYIADLGETIARYNPDGTITLTDAFFGHNEQARKELLAHEKAHGIVNDIYANSKIFWDIVNSGLFGKYDSDAMKFKGVPYALRNVDEILTQLVADLQIGVPKKFRDKHAVQYNIAQQMLDGKEVDIRQAIQQALSEGKPVPPEVLKDYPELKPAAEEVKPAELTPVSSGKTVTAKTERGTAIETKYAVVEADSLVASHDTNLWKNPNYPAELQPRDRGRTASELQINRIVQKLKPEFLGQSPKASEGAPIVGKDGVVESGNARVIALQKIYDLSHANAGKYKNWLLANAGKFGLDKKDIEAADNPILVRVRLTDVDRVKFAQEANEQAVARMSASEQAKVDAGKLTGEFMATFVPSETGEILTAANQKFVSGFMAHVVGDAERGDYLTKDGAISQAGASRMRNAVFYKAYGNIEAIEKLAESTDVNVKNQINAMLTAAPRIVRVKEAIAKGELYDLDISADIAAAMNVLSSLRETGTTIERYFTQTSLLPDELTPLGKDILRLFDEYKRSAKKISDILKNHLDLTEMLGDPKQVALVGRNIPTKAEALEWAVRKVKGLDEEQLDLLSDQGMDDTEAGSLGEGVSEKAEGEKTTGTQAFAGQAQQLRYQQKNPNIVEPVKRRDIINFLSEKLNIPVRVGRFRQRALGIFKIKPEVIRTKLANDIPTIAHEVGHYLDKRLGLVDRAYDAELQALGQKTSKPSYSKGQVRAEGVAEFMRLYLTEPGEALKQAPGYYAAFENRMLANGEIHDILLQARQDIKVWTEQPAKARILGSLSIGEKKPRKMSLERLYTAAVDELRPIEKYVKEVAGVNVDVERNPFIIAWLARGWTGKAETYLYHGTIDDNYNKTGPALEEILKPLSKNLDDFRAYLVAKRAVELHGRAKRTGIDHDDAKEVIKDLETPDFKDAQKKLVEYQDALIDELIEAGVISQEAATAMRQLNQNYVPFYRVFGEQMGATYGFSKGGYGNITNPVKKLKGSERDIIDPLESIIKNTFYMVNVAERNRVGEAIVKLAESKEGTGKWVELLPAPMHGVKVSLEEIEGVLESVGVDTDAIDLDTVAHVFRPTYFPPGKENILTVFRNGKKRFYQLEPELYRATLALDKETSNLFINLISLPAKTLRAGATLTPEFMARNPIRDIQEAMVFSNYGFNPIDFAKGLFHALKQDDIFWKWKASGGAHGAMVSLDRDYLQGSLKDLLAKGAKDKALNILKNPLEILQALSEFGEQATRIGEFAKGLKHEPQTRTGTMLASLSSRDVTLDFGRAGYSGKIPNRVIAFFNANVQGIDKIFREFRRNPNRSLLRCLSYITLPTVLLYFFNRKDKRYQELPQWQKDVYWIIPTKEKLYRVPKPFTLGVIFGAFPERVLSYMDTKSPKAFDEFGESLRENALPDLIPTAFMGWIEAYSNKSFYTGRPIVPRSEEMLEPEMQYTSYTSETAKLVGSLLEYSPRKIDHILKSYGGGLATHGTKIVDGLIKLVDKKERVAKPAVTASDYPLVGAFVPRMWASADSIDKFYQKLDDMEREYKTAKKKGYTGPAKKELTNFRSVARELSKLRVAAQDVHTHQTMTAKEKRDILDIFSILQINMARKTLGMELITKEEASIK